MNILQRAAQMQAAFTRLMADNGYKTITTFYGDLTIAEIDGPDGVRETYGRIVKEWRNNVQYYTEFVMALNHKIWEHYKTNKPLAEAYNELWEQADGWACDNLTGDDLDYYYSTTD